VRVFSEVISMAIPGPGKGEYLPPAGRNSQASGKRHPLLTGHNRAL
jgi:hypothetical protein